MYRKPRWRAGLLIFLILGSGEPEPAGAQEALTLHSAVQGALERHPSVAGASATTERASASVEEARAARLPVLHLDASAFRFAKPMVVAPLHGFDPRQPPHFDQTLVQGGLSASYMLFDGGAGAARVRASTALEEAAGAGEAGARLALISETARTYLRALSAREAVRAHEHRVRAVEQERWRAGRLFEEGRSPRVVLLRADAALSAARADLVSARVDAAVSERELARLLGIDPERVRSASIASVAMGDTTVPERGALVARAASENPDVRRMRAQVLAARAGRAQARSLWMPRLQLTGRYVEYASGEGMEAGEWQGGVQLSYPVFTGGGRDAATDRAAADARLAESELAAAELRSAAAVDRALGVLEAARARVSALAAGVEQAEEVVRIELLALENGAGLQSEYLAAVAERLRNRAALTEARYAEIGARVELARLTGELSAAWLATHMESEQ